jgi:O-acetyl-ADP-ribose deacetylase (regulator of RNase III)
MAVPIEIDVWQGDIAELEVDALVISANESLFMTAGAAASVKRRGGEEIEQAAVDQGPVPPGTAVVTHAGTLAAGYVIHAVAVGHDRQADPDRLRSAIQAALITVEPLQLRRVAVSLLGVESGVFASDDAAAVLVETLMATDAPLESVVVAAPQANDVEAVRVALAARRSAAR